MIRSRAAWPPKALAAVFGALSFAIRVPFLLRYDLHFGSDAAISYLMALRITDGDRPLYFYGQDYQGSPEAYAAAALFSIVGPSIPVAAIVSLTEWAIATGIGVYLVQRATNAFTAAVCGLVAAIGVPYTLHYVTVPYWGYPSGVLVAMALLLQTFLLLQHGWSVRRTLIFAATAGFGLYLSKQCLPGLVASVLVLIIKRRSIAKPANLGWLRVAAAAVGGLLLGYAPELWYRLHAGGSRSFAAVADPATVWANLRFTAVSLLAYFDGQPVSRIPEGTNFFGHFYSRLPDSSIYPEGAGDWSMVIVAAVALAYAAGAFWRVRDRRQAPLLLLAMLIAVNLAAVVISHESQGLFLNTRRYLYPSAIALSIFAGLPLAALLQHQRPWVRAAGVACGLLFAGRVLTHEIVLLRSPDELADLRRIAAQLRADGVRYGLSKGNTYELVALTNQDITIASRNVERIPEYIDLVQQAEMVAIIEPKTEPIETEVSFAGNVYRPAGPPREGDILRWLIYRKSAVPSR